MNELTTRQRDILQLLLKAKGPQGAHDLAESLNLTPRQINYGLHGLDAWLESRGVVMSVTPGVGMVLSGSTEHLLAIQRELMRGSNFQLVLTTDQRYQLLAFFLLTAAEPCIAYQLQQQLQVSRTTILKDLDEVAEWLPHYDLELTRRPNFGIWVDGDELKRRQALLALLWGHVPFADSPFAISHADSLVFALEDDAHLLPILGVVQQQLAQWDVVRMLSHVTYAEAQLGGRFTDDAVLLLALTLAIQTQRVAAGHVVAVDAALLDWLRPLPVWDLAVDMARRLSWRQVEAWPESEVAALVMSLLTTHRNERWPGDLEIDAVFSDLVEQLLDYIATAYAIPALVNDTSLRDGLLIHIIPACLRQRFGIWLPTTNEIVDLPERYRFEQELALELLEVIAEKTAVSLPPSELRSLVLLLRAAYIREQPANQREVVVVCPSGMATAQLLIARLKTRFPGLGNPRILSLREVNTTTLATADLIVTTVPLRVDVGPKTAVIQVHPLLLPEDIDAITAWLS